MPRCLGARARALSGEQLHRAGPARPAHRAGLLPVRLQPRVHRPAAAVRGARSASSPSRARRMYGVSCDSAWAQAAFREKLGVSSEQLSDFEPKGAACAAFGVLHEGGFPQRALVDRRPATASCAGATGGLAGRAAGPRAAARRPRERLRGARGRRIAAGAAARRTAIGRRVRWRSRGRRQPRWRMAPR